MSHIHTTSAHLYNCDCGCGQTITVEFVDGFAGTTCRVEACAKRRRIAMPYFEIPRSAALAMEPAEGYTISSHSTGLVTMGGAR